MPIFGLIAAAFLNHQYLNILGNSAEQILSKNYKSIRAAQDMRKSFDDSRTLLLDPLSAGKPLKIISGQIIEDIASNLMVCEMNITEKGELELIDRLHQLFDKYKILREEQSGSGQVWDNRFLSITTEVINNIDDLVVLNEKAMERAEHQTRILADQAQANAAFLFGVVIAAMIGLNYFFSYRIARPIMVLAHQLSKTREGSGIYPKISLKSNDEIGFLARSFNQLFNRLEQYDNNRDYIISQEKEKVRRSEEAKGKFIADISHQLKTPMTSLSMSLGLLKSRGEKLGIEKRDKLLLTAYNDCKRLNVLINELVDISRLEIMSMPRPKETLDIKMVVDESLSPLIDQAEKKGVQIKKEIPEKIPRLTIDSFRFPWVITNLVGNALRYTSTGGLITLKIFQKGSRVYFQCKDTGDGIKPEVLPRIFDRFTQFSERGKSGTIGLGLAIVKDIIDQHGGDITVQSTPGKGTEFTFWVPGIKESKDEESIDH
ncbi:HAMP domain-containing sensor histidine kinase [Desulfamplus magnetovallimortis]|uniref:HAMP domain-containing sensor histidine kinase n=1 Tax=Desulfamplus magnetovallimortis TaxID=1246637 RepID=UPI0009B945D3|nr:HAMP domain-containing sensor histidine kinase [Desulfamplus magnetovallimortis]